MGDLPSTSSSQPPPSASVGSTSGAVPAQSGVAPRTLPPDADADSAIRQTPAWGIDELDVGAALAPPRVPGELAEDGPRPARPIGSEGDGGDLGVREPPPGASWRPRDTLPVHARYGRFELLGKIARGGMAEILLARERSGGGASRHVVVKRILPQSAEDDDYVRMFLTEGQLMMGLSHPNLCHVYDVGHHGDTSFIAMEWVHGQSLARVIRRARELQVGLPAPLAARMIADVAAALHHAHNAKDSNGRPMHLVHRDVSPHNVMVAYDGGVKLLDFGIAKVTTSSEHTTTGVVKGKFAYMAPEQCLARPLDARADVFALGVCLYEALTGRALYRRANEYETLRAVIKEPVPSIRAVDARLPVVLDRIVQKALQKKPEARFDGALSMQLALERYLADERHLVSPILVGRLMRRLFANEIRGGPRLEPIAVQPGVDLAPEAPSPELGGAAPGAAGVADAAEVASEVSSRITGVSRLRAPADRRPSVLLTLGVACIVAAGAWLGWREGVVRIGPGTAAVPAEQVVADTSSPPPAASPPGFAAPMETTAAAAPSADGPADPADPAAAAAPAAPSGGVVPAEEARGAIADPAGVPHAEEGATGDDEERARAPGWSRLSLNTRPWSRVYLRGRLLGTTPLGDIRVPAGRARLRLVDRDGQVHHRALLLRAGERTERFLDLAP